MTKVAAKLALLQQMAADGVDVLFGNPGSVEQGLMDALPLVPAIRYVLGLHENVVLGMADGYARSTGRPAVAQVHTAVGLGNASALLYQARRSLTPLVVIAGEVSLGAQNFDGFLHADLVEMARPVTKWAERVMSGDRLLACWRRALKLAATPPQGPVFLALPMDVLDAQIEAEIRPTIFPDWHASPDVETIAAAARMLVDARRPMLLVGDGVSVAGAREQVEELSRLLGAPIYGMDFANLSVSLRHPLFQGFLGHGFGEDNSRITSQADVVFAIGTPLFSELFPSTQPYFSQGAKLLQLDASGWELSKNFVADIAILADPKPTLSRMLAALRKEQDASAVAAARTRMTAWSQRKADGLTSRRRIYNERRAESPMAPSRVAETVVECLPANAVVYDESITSTDELLDFLQPEDPQRYFLGRGGCLGVGWTGAVGAALAQTSQPVLAISGDGSALFVLQSLWTAAHHRLHVVFLVLNNHSYRILKTNLIRYRAEQGTPSDSFPHMDLGDPPIDFAPLAAGFGVPGVAVATPDELARALREAFARPGPSLIDVQVSGSVAQELGMVAGDGR